MRNRTKVRPGFSVGTAKENAKEMWRILHAGGELHLITSILYGPYNDEEQRLIRVAFRRLSGGIDFHFYVKQASAMTPAFSSRRRSSSSRRFCSNVAGGARKTR